MDDKERQAAVMSALVTEHFVLQPAASGSVNEAGSRASLYLLSLSSALVAMGFAAGSREVFVPFVATVLPAVFLLGVFTVIRLIDSAIEYNRFLVAIARIRAYYRTLTPRAADLFSAASGQWPEAKAMPAVWPSSSPTRTGATTLSRFLSNSRSLVRKADREEGYRCAAGSSSSLP